MSHGGHQRVTTWNVCHMMGVVTWQQLRPNVCHMMGVVTWQQLRPNGCSLGMDYGLWSLGTWAVLGQLENRLGIGCITLRA